jgi:hypothetical protein
LGKDIGLGEFLKYSDHLKTKGIDSATFSKATQGIINTETLVNIGIRVGSGVVAKMIENGTNSLNNKDNGKVPLLTSSTKTPMGKSSATYEQTKVHIGCQTTKRLKRMRFNPNIDYDEKLISSSNRDYLGHEKRKNLMVTSGFNQKGYTFLLEDTYFTVDDYLKLYNHQDKITKILQNSKAKTDLYGCVYKSKNQFKFMNKLDFYDLTMKLHLVKLTDQNKDVRELINDITNNKLSTKVPILEKDPNSFQRYKPSLKYGKLLLGGSPPLLLIFSQA